MIIKSLMSGLLIAGPVSVVMVVARPDPRLFVSAIEPLCFSCGGCEAEPIEDDDGFMDGVRITSILDGVSMGPHGLDLTSSSCSWVQGQGGQWSCDPNDPCTFKFYYAVMANAAIGGFHDNYVGPCNWSSPAGPYGEEALSGSVSWMGACNGNESVGGMSCYNNATYPDCSSGTSILQVHYGAKCTACSGEG